jgi:hypothetical protein
MSTKDTVDKMMADAQAGAARICRCGTCAVAVKRAEEIFTELVDYEYCASYVEVIAMALQAYAHMVANRAAPRPTLQRFEDFQHKAAPMLSEKFMLDMVKRLKG